MLCRMLYRAPFCSRSEDNLKTVHLSGIRNTIKDWIRAVTGIGDWKSPL